MMKSKYDFPLINGLNSDKLNLIILNTFASGFFSRIISTMYELGRKTRYNFKGNIFDISNSCINKIIPL